MTCHRPLALIKDLVFDKHTPWKYCFANDKKFYEARNTEKADNTEKAMTRPILTFQNGAFILNGTKPQPRHATLWESEKFGFKTSYLRAAIEFKSYADDAAKKVIKRACQEHYDIPDLTALTFLDPHQFDGVAWALGRKRSYLAHAPGAGKTCEAIVVACLAQGRGQTLIIVPPTLVANWVREIMRFTDPFEMFPTIGVVTNSANQDDVAWQAEFIVCPDSMLTRTWVYERLRGLKKKVVIVDEASRFKEATSARSLAFYGGRSRVRFYQGLFQGARHVVLLDGSPMPNRPMELWAPAFALHPESIDFMPQVDFGFKYCGAQIGRMGHWEFKHSSNEAELKAKLQKDFMHVVTEDKLSHPERFRSILVLSHDLRTPEQRAWEKRQIEKLDFGTLSEASNQGDLARYRRELGIQKTPLAAVYVRERIREKNESILVFAWHREVCLKLAELLGEFNPGVVMGGTEGVIRETLFQEFQEGRRKLIIGNIQAMGRGHNLQKADRVIFAEYSWTDELNKQCEKRASRRGRNQSAFVRCEYLVAPSSLDERVLNTLFAKEQRVKKVIG